ncbi:MAG: ATP-binding cassette domain-containing protein, partial [Elusimicrobia bacterium]|nr:ATP-binding cassette domain-containing protein [Elusimicrobiota bacterium]
MSDIALRLRGVSKRFYLSDNLRRESAWATTYRLLTGESEHRPIWAVKEVSLELKRGEMLGIIGPNGAGKSTLLLLAAQILEPTEGVVEVYGKTSSFFQLAAGLSPKLSVLESFELTAALLGMDRARYRKLLPQIIEFSGLEEFLYAKYGELSSGMAARVAFSTAVHSDLDIILIDEGMSVGDEAFQNKCKEKLYGLLGAGKTFIIISHELDKIASLSSRILYLNRGYPVFLGEPADAVERMRRDFGLTADIDRTRKQALGIVNDIPKQLLSLRSDISSDIAATIRDGMASMQDAVVRELEVLIRHHMDDIKSRLATLEKAAGRHDAGQSLSGLREELASLRAEVQALPPVMRKDSDRLVMRLGEARDEVKILRERVDELSAAFSRKDMLAPEEELRREFAAYMGISPDCVFFSHSHDAPEALDGLLNILCSGKKHACLYAGVQPNALLESAGWGLLPVGRDTESFGLSARALEAAFASAEKPAAVVASHVNGILPRMDEISALCLRHGVPLIEDMGGLLGGSLKGIKMGTFDSLAYLDCSVPDCAVPLWDTAVYFLSGLSEAARPEVEKLFKNLGYQAAPETARTAKTLLMRSAAAAQARVRAYQEYEALFASLRSKAQAQKAPFGVVGAPDSYCFIPAGGNTEKTAKNLLSKAEKTLDAWERHPCLRPLVEKGRLDFARFDAVRDTEIRLGYSGERLSAGT